MRRKTAMGGVSRTNPNKVVRYSQKQVAQLQPNSKTSPTPFHQMWEGHHRLPNEAEGRTLSHQPFGSMRSFLSRNRRLPNEGGKENSLTPTLVSGQGGWEKHTITHLFSVCALHIPTQHLDCPSLRGQYCAPCETPSGSPL